MWIPVDILGFAAAAVSAAVLRRRVKGWSGTTAAVLGVVGFDVACSRIPFRGPGSEVAVGAIAFGALVLLMARLMSMADGNGTRRGRRAGRRSFGGLVLAFLLVAILMPWTRRLSVAERMAWACDGEVVRKYRSNNHRAPTLAVRDVDGHERVLEGVEMATFERANVGDHLRKGPWEAQGWINGTSVRMVPE